MGNVVEDTNGVQRGLIGYTKDNQQNVIMFFAKDCDPKNIPRVGDKVRLCLI